MKNQAKTRRGSFGIFLTAALLLAVLIAFPKSGEAIPYTGTGALGSFELALEYVSNADGTEATLTVTLKNTSDPGNKGYLTGFALNLPSNLAGIESAALTDASGYSGFSQIGGAGSGNAVNSAPYGQFDIGAALGGNFEGGGKPKGGIGVNETATFVFSLTGTNLRALTVDSFLNELSGGTGAGEGYQAFVARFRGFENDGSDKVPVSVPEPGTLILVGAGLLGLGIFGIRKFKGRI